MTHRLMPCPICGTSPQIDLKQDDPSCTNRKCFMSVLPQITVEQWNTRATPAPSHDAQSVDDAELDAAWKAYREKFPEASKDYASGKQYDAIKAVLEATREYRAQSKQDAGTPRQDGVMSCEECGRVVSREWLGQFKKDMGYVTSRCEICEKQNEVDNFPYITLHHLLHDCHDPNKDREYAKQKAKNLVKNWCNAQLTNRAQVTGDSDELNEAKRLISKIYTQLWPTGNDIAKDCQRFLTKRSTAEKMEG